MSRILFRIADKPLQKNVERRALIPENVSPEEAIVHEWRPLLRRGIRRQVDPLREFVSPDRFRIRLAQFHTAHEPCGAIVTLAVPEIRTNAQGIYENIVVG